ncbi:MAG TPA: tripartite tricarboxylate transporter TctB family protein [Terriglobales bacterium]|nr:tripartite tricarboxylate transporter TctB family protein [Terriglobales bacterium]
MRRPTVEALVLVALGVTAVVEGLRLKDNWQGAKLMPAVLGLTLVLLGLAHLALRFERAAWPERGNAARVVVIFAVLAGYVLLLEPAGFLPATAAMVLIVVRVLGTFSWPVTVLSTAAIAIASHVVFRHWLGMPLPVGAFGF